MKKLFPLLAALLFAPLCVFAQPWAKAKLEKSPRHQEWVAVTNGKAIKCFVVYPEVKDKATTIVLVHEIFGLSDWVREMADELAAEGYIVIAPDLLSFVATNGTDAFPDQSARIKAVSGLPVGKVQGDLDMVVDYAKTIPAANGKIVVAGFCWGGGQSFLLATGNKDLKAAFVFYGSAPSARDMAFINCPVYGFYAGNDARISATVPKTTDQMKAAGKIYEPVTYDGGGHGFMRAGEAPDADDANKKARAEAFKRWLELLKKI